MLVFCGAFLTGAGAADMVVDEREEYVEEGFVCCRNNDSVESIEVEVEVGLAWGWGWTNGEREAQVHP